MPASEPEKPDSPLSSPASTAGDRPLSVPPPPSQVMMRTVGGILWGVLFVALLVIGTTGGPPKPAKPPQDVLIVTGEDESIPVKLVPRQVADFEFTERSGKTVTREDLLGKPWVVNFIFTSCVMTCPANTTAMMKLAQASKDLDVQFVTITVDPERDTPERLRDYAEIYGADPDQWWFLTGDKQKIHDLILHNFLQVVEEQQGKNRLLGYEFAHSDRVMHIDAEGKIVGQYLSTDPTEMAKLRRVLAGEMETPQENRFLVAEPIEPEEAEEEAAEEITTSELPSSSSGEQNSGKQKPHQQKTDEEAAVPAWLKQLPAVNAFLNGVATLLLMTGFVLIRQRKIDAHKTVMLTAFGVSVLFLACYLTYHFGLHYYTGESSKKFPNIGFLRQVYLTILISHIILAVPVPVLAILTIFQAWKQRWEKHLFLARITFPIWLYVSVTGVIIYVMLYHLAGAVTS